MMTALFINDNRSITGVQFKFVGHYYFAVIFFSRLIISSSSFIVYLTILKSLRQLIGILIVAVLKNLKILTQGLQDSIILLHFKIIYTGIYSCNHYSIQSCLSC